jgi:hypothetical protein
VRMYIIDHCDMILCNNIPPFVYHFCMWSTPTNGVIFAHMYIYSCCIWRKRSLV